MKNIFLLIILGTAMCYSFSHVQNIEPASATVEQEQGLYIFTHCKPVAAYDYIGTVKIKVTMSGSPDELFSKAIKKAKKEFPTGDGIIFNAELDKADVIKFK